MEQNTDIGASMSPEIDNKQKNRNRLKITAAIACIVAICGIGFGVYGIVQCLQKDNQINNLEKQIGEYQNIRVSGQDEIIADIKSVGYYFTDENAPELKDFESEDIISWRGINLHLQPNGSVEAAFQNVDWESYMPKIKEQQRKDFEKDILTNYIDGRVVDIAVGLVGNGANEVILFLLDDGTVDYISSDSILLREYNFKKVPGANGIVRIYGNLNIIDYAGYVQFSSGKISPILIDTTNDTLYVEK